jgi:hypothetical protein
VATANPYPNISFSPTEPCTDPPLIILQSPSNTTLHENDVPLDFIVTKPDSWLQAPYTNSCYIAGVKCWIDGKLVTFYNPIVTLYNPNWKIYFSTVLVGLSEGQHTLQINVTAWSHYDPSQTGYWFTWQRASLDGSKKIIFTVDTVSNIPEFPSWTPLLITLIGVVAILVVYRNKLKKQKAV